MDPAQTPIDLRPAQPGDVIGCAASESFGEWLGGRGGSVAITTYQAGKVALAGWDGTKVTLLLRHFSRPLGLAAKGRSLAVATRDAIVLLADAPLLARDFDAQRPGRYDALYLPRATFLTGELNVHDVAFAADGLLFVNTRFSCLARVSTEFGFIPRWKPPFVSGLAPEDRCHLNGLALGTDGRPLFVTALGATDTPGGWRDNKTSGGVVVHVPSGETVLRGLCMPHAPRLREGRLWLLNSGTGELCVADTAAGRLTPVCGLRGYLRGLCFVGDYALVGLSQVRERHTFAGLPIQQRHAKLLCGVAVVDLRSGREVAMLEFTTGCHELYDVQFLPGVQRPMLLGLEGPGPDRQALVAPGFAYWATRLQEGPATSQGIAWP
jgi:uncharacterized protein (TIGR03032 family)